MKPVGRDKKLWKALEKGYVEDQMDVNVALFGKDANEGGNSPPQPISINGMRRSESITTFGNSATNSPSDPPGFRTPERSPTLDSLNDNEHDDRGIYRLPGQLDKSERKTLFTLKSTLNAAFPHHDFAGIGADQFSREKNGAIVLTSLSNTLRSVGLQSSSASLAGGSRGLNGDGRGGLSVGYLANAPRATTYSAYPGEGRMFSPSSIPTRSGGIDVLKELERRRMGEYEAEVVTATHPVLFGVLDDAIGLKQGQCEIYVWTPPNWETDPHGSGSGELDSDGECLEDSTDDEEEEEELDSPDKVFLEDDELGDETESEDSEGRRKPFYYPGGISIRQSHRSPFGQLRKHGSLPQPSAMAQIEKQLRRVRPQSSSPTRNRMRLRGSLLWSNHWFFVNRKQKRVLFISIWAKSRGYGLSPSSPTVIAGMKHEPEMRHAERFLGWDGARGAGARAFAERRVGSSLF